MEKLKLGEMEMDFKQLKMRILKLAHFAISVGLFFACWTLFYNKGATDLQLRFDLLISCCYAICLIFLGRVYKMYVIGFNRVLSLIYTQSLASVISIGITYVLHFFAYLKLANPLPLIGLFVIQVGLNVAWSYVANRIYFSMHQPKRTVLVYRNEEDLNRLGEVKKFTQKFVVEKCVQCDSDDYEEIVEVIGDYEAVFVAGVNATLRNAIAKYCVDKGILGYFVPHVGDIIMMGSRHVVQFSVPVMNVRRAALDPEYVVIKRLIDIFVSLCGIIVLSPLMVVVAVAIKAYDKGPVLYKQTRLTKDGKEFKIWKFRSMKVDAEKDGVARLASDNDDRITPIGKIVRACRFDELPQLFNILSGDMTIVGPRPERPEIAAQYEEVLPSFRLRLQVKAGLTGTAQIYGKYNSTPYDKLEMDLLYINNMSLLEDIKLMFGTIRILFMKDSTSGVEEGQITAVKDFEDVKSAEESVQTKN